ncbi:MAG: hypothetical protein JW959_11050 [Pirellulales bacterium]|nr:hypothetical protein [Pirellulales bacterium]
MSLIQENRAGRLTAVLIVGAMWLSLGCSTASKLTGILPGPFGQGAKEEQLRQAVEADDFPPAKQVGL